MHELSIVLSIVEIAEQETLKAGARQVERIELEIGALSGVALDALDFAWDMGVKGSVLEQAERCIHQLPGRARCLECGQEFGINQLYEACPGCGSYLLRVLQGQEMRVRALEVSG